MELNLKGRTALVTGGSRGIGLGIARVFASEGVHLHLASVNPANLEAARKEITRSYEVEVTTHAYDLSRSDNVQKLVAACGPVNILVNNAGAIPHGTIESTGEQSWREGWELKVFAYVNLTREVYRQMRAQRRGVILNVIGINGERPDANAISASTANAGLMAMSRALGVESVNHGVRILAVNPGGTETDRQKDRWKARAKKELGDENRWRELTTGLPLGRLASVDEVAATIVFLCSDRSGYTSGTVVTVDGGQSGRK